MPQEVAGQADCIHKQLLTRAGGLDKQWLCGLHGHMLGVRRMLEKDVAGAAEQKRYLCLRLWLHFWFRLSLWLRLNPILSLYSRLQRLQRRVAHHTCLIRTLNILIRMFKRGHSTMHRAAQILRAPSTSSQCRESKKAPPTQTRPPLGTHRSQAVKILLRPRTIKNSTALVSNMLMGDLTAILRRKVTREQGRRQPCR